MSLPLRYKICRWPQAVKCLSNNSRKLKIKVTELLSNKYIHGMMIEVKHAEIGTLFAAVIQGEGEIVSNKTKEGDVLPWMTTSEILKQLLKFGFDITYTERLTLDSQTLDLLITLRNLGYDKVTKLVVACRKEDGTRILKSTPVAIKSEYNQDKLVYGTSISYKLFTKRVISDSIYNLQDISNDTIKWDWIDAMYGIDDILADNSDIEDFEAWVGETRIDKNMPYTSPEYNSDLTPYDSTLGG